MKGVRRNPDARFFGDCMRVTLTKDLFRLILIFILGTVLFIFGSTVRYRYSHALDLNRMTAADVRTDAIVTGELKEFVKQGSQVTSAEWMLGLRDYEIYIVPLSDGTYLRVAVYEESKKYKITNSYVNAAHPVTVTGKLKAMKFDNIWAENAGISADQIKANIVLVEKDFTEELRFGYYGLAIMIVSGILLATGLYKRYIQMNDEEIYKAEVAPSRMDPELELISDEKTYGILEQRLKDKHRSYWIFLVIFVLTLLAVIAPYAFEHSKFLWFIVMTISLISCIRSWLHFDNKVSRKISKMFGIDSVANRMQNVRANMERLRFELAKEEGAKEDIADETE